MSDVFVFGVSSFLEALFIALIFIPLIMLWVFALADLFRRDDLAGGWKILWLFAIVLLPLIGVIIYFLVRRPSRDVSMELPDDATAGGPAGELERLKALHDSGTIDDEEFAKLKAQVIG